MADDEDLEQDVPGRRHDLGLPRHALIVVALGIVLAAPACKKTSHDISPDPSARPKKDAAPDDDESVVWSLVIDEVATPQAGAIFVMKQSTTHALCAFDELAKSIPTAKQETIDALAAKAEPAPLRLQAHVPVRMIDDMNDAGYWNAAQVLELSRVAFDGPHRDALVYVTDLNGPMVLDRVLHLVRDGASWRKMEIARCWPK